MQNTLQLVIVLLASAVFVVALFRGFGLPPLLGYLIAGVVIGPHALGWIPESRDASYLAEFGVVFLMFSVALEFSLGKLKQMRRLVFGLGFAQVLATSLVVFAGCMALGLDWKTGLALGAVFAMSSTAIVSRMLSEKMQLDSAQGREVVGVLLFQDLAVVPFLVLIPALAANDGELLWRMGLAALKATAILAVVLFLGQRVMRYWFHAVARRRSQELFILNVLFITLGLAYVTELAGLSLALGAFLAGLLIAETEYRHQVEADIKPFREVLLGLFFITVGMRLDAAVVWNNLALVMFVLVVSVLLKFALVTLLSRAFGSATGTALRSGLALAQAGEFGLVLLVLAMESGVIEHELSQIVTAAMLLSMLIAPFAIEHSDRLVMRWSTTEWMTRALDLHRIAVQGLAAEGHAVICGYGRTGQRIAHLLEQAGIRTMSLDLDPERVREATAAGEAVVFGDASRHEALVAAGVARARVLVVTFSDAGAARRILELARHVNPSIPVVVRTLDDAELEPLLAAGATEVVPETFESSLMLASHAMVLLGVPLRQVVRQIGEVRRDRYQLLRGFFEGESDRADDLDLAREPRLHSVVLEPGASAAGRTLGSLELSALEVSVAVLRRRDARFTHPDDATVLQAGDVVVLLGTPENLAAAEIRLLQGL
jgi:monovalent cation:H+ antiporter-2, CPA2 family